MSKENPIGLILDTSTMGGPLLNSSVKHAYLKDSTCLLYKSFGRRPDAYVLSKPHIIMLKSTPAKSSKVRLMTNKATIIYDIPNTNIPAYNDFLEFYKPFIYIEQGCKYARFVPIKCKFFRNLDELELDEMEDSETKAV